MYTLGRRAERDADELRGRAERRDADTRARARTLVHELDAVDAHAFAVAERRRAEAAGRRDEPDVPVGAVAGRREHVLGERVQSVAGRDERIGQRFEHPATLRASS